MFGKLKDKLKSWAKKVSETAPDQVGLKEGVPSKEGKEIVEKPKKEKKKMPQKSAIRGTPSGEVIKKIKKISEKKVAPKGVPSIPEAEGKETIPEPAPKDVSKEGTSPSEEDKEIEKEPIKKKSFFKKIISKKKTISPEEFKNYSEDLEMILLENNVALEVADKIINELEDKIVSKEMNKKEIENLIVESLKEIIKEVLLPPFDILKEIKEKDGPYVMVFCGINGVGKTTQIAKIAHMLKQKGITSVMAAADTFRAAALEQLKEHGENLDIKVITHEYGSDPAAVGFDAIKYAEKNKIDVVLIDTAGRIHTATNLLREMNKIKKVTNPDRTIFVGESITGNDAVDQVKAFNDAIGIDGIFLSKADIDEKGGTALSVGYITKKPIIYLGTGQNYEDLEPFDKDKFIEKLGL